MNFINQLIANNQLNEALSSIDIVIEAGTAKQTHLVTKKDILVQLRKLEDLCDHLENYPSSFEEDPEGLSWCAWVYKQKGQNDKFEAIYERKISQENNKSFILASHKHTHKSLHDIINNDDLSGKQRAQAYVNKALYHSKSISEQKDYILKAYEADPRNPEIRTFLANFHDLFGEKWSAEHHYQMAHLMMPQNPVFLDNLAEYYFRQKDWDRALNLWTKNKIVYEFVAPKIFLMSLISGQQIPEFKIHESVYNTLWHEISSKEWIKKSGVINNILQSNAWGQRIEWTVAHLLQSIKCADYQQAHTLIRKIINNRRCYDKELFQTCNIYLFQIISEQQNTSINWNQLRLCLGNKFSIEELKSEHKNGTLWNLIFIHYGWEGIPLLLDEKPKAV